MSCYISNQIADYCNQPEELFCPECGGEMSHDKDGDLLCDDIECTGMIILNSDDFEV